MSQLGTCGKCCLVFWAVLMAFSAVGSLLHHVVLPEAFRIIEAKPACRAGFGTYDDNATGYNCEECAWNEVSRDGSFRCDRCVGQASSSYPSHDRSTCTQFDPCDVTQYTRGSPINPHYMGVGCVLCPAGKYNPSVASLPTLATAPMACFSCGETNNTASDCVPVPPAGPRPTKVLKSEFDPSWSAHYENEVESELSAGLSMYLMSLGYSYESFRPLLHWWTRWLERDALSKTDQRIMLADTTEEKFASVIAHKRWANTSHCLRDHASCQLTHGGGLGRKSNASCFNLLVICHHRTFLQNKTTVHFVVPDSLTQATAIGPRHFQEYSAQRVQEGKQRLVEARSRYDKQPRPVDRCPTSLVAPGSGHSECVKAFDGGCGPKLCPRESYVYPDRTAWTRVFRGFSMGSVCTNATTVLKHNTLTQNAKKTCQICTADQECHYGFCKSPRHDPTSGCTRCSHGWYGDDCADKCPASSLTKDIPLGVLVLYVVMSVLYVFFKSSGAQAQSEAFDEAAGAIGDTIEHAKETGGVLVAIAVHGGQMIGIVMPTTTLSVPPGFVREVRRICLAIASSASIDFMSFFTSAECASSFRASWLARASVPVVVTVVYGLWMCVLKCRDKKTQETNAEMFDVCVHSFVHLLFVFMYVTTARLGMEMLNCSKDETGRWVLLYDQEPCPFLGTGRNVMWDIVALSFALFFVLLPWIMTIGCLCRAGRQERMKPERSLFKTAFGWTTFSFTDLNYWWGGLEALYKIAMIAVSMWATESLKVPVELGVTFCMACFHAVRRPYNEEADWPSSIRNLLPPKKFDYTQGFGPNNGTTMLFYLVQLCFLLGDFSMVFVVVAGAIMLMLMAFMAYQLGMLIVRKIREAQQGLEMKKTSTLEEGPTASPAETVFLFPLALMFTAMLFAAQLLLVLPIGFVVALMVGALLFCLVMAGEGNVDCDDMNALQTCCNKGCCCPHETESLFYRTTCWFSFCFCLCGNTREEIVKPASKWANAGGKKWKLCMCLCWGIPLRAVQVALCLPITLLSLPSIIPMLVADQSDAIRKTLQMTKIRLCPCWLFSNYVMEGVKPMLKGAASTLTSVVPTGQSYPPEQLEMTRTWGADY